MSLNDRPCVLVADPETETLTQMMSILRPDDFRVVTANCQNAALAAVQREPVKMVLCDWLLATRGGELNLIDRIRAAVPQDTLSFVFTSSVQTTGVIRRRHDFGGAYHIQKPFEPAVVISLIERTLWMPRLAHTHIQRPHFQIKSAMPLSAGIAACDWKVPVADSLLPAEPRAVTIDRGFARL